MLHNVIQLYSRANLRLSFLADRTTESPIHSVYTIWLAIGIIMSSVSLSICLSVTMCLVALRVGVQDQARTSHLMTGWGRFSQIVDLFPSPHFSPPFSVSFPISLPSRPSSLYHLLPFPPPSPSLSFRAPNSLTAARGSGGAPQRVRAEPGRQAVSGAFWVKKSNSGYSNLVVFLSETSRWFIANS